ncbi:MAG: hypothetical protein EA001_02530 [Oscillatoriales cyanobacterium]|nr:MAG: hypothetical protein EA001_02530 [Oscillatoriales cyanobacterium]
MQASQQVRHYVDYEATEAIGIVKTMLVKDVDRKAEVIGTAIVKYHSPVTGGWRVWFQSSYWSIANGDGLQLKESDRLEVVGYDNGNQLLVQTV